MTLDLPVRGAEIVDGSGAPRYRAEVGVAGGETPGEVLRGAWP